MAQGPLKRMAQGPQQKGQKEPLGLLNLVFLYILMRHASCPLKAVTLLFIPYHESAQKQIALKEVQRNQGHC
jgi:hypothetical protein